MAEGEGGDEEIQFLRTVCNAFLTYFDFRIILLIMPF